MEATIPELQSRCLSDKNVAELFLGMTLFNPYSPSNFAKFENE